MPRSAKVVEHDLGLTAVIEGESMERAWHALADGGRVWLVDPLDDRAFMESAAALGEPAAVVQLLDRHGRDCAAIAERMGVPHHRVPDSVPGSPFSAIPALRIPRWRETALWWPSRSALVVAEVVGSGPTYAVGSGRVGIHPFLRAWPPASLRGMRPAHLLFGHGPPIHGPECPVELERAFERARRDIPAFLRALPSFR
jgi:hypothetical protein